MTPQLKADLWVKRTLCFSFDMNWTLKLLPCVPMDTSTLISVGFTTSNATGIHKLTNNTRSENLSDTSAHARVQRSGSSDGETDTLR